MKTAKIVKLADAHGVDHEPAENGIIMLVPYTDVSIGIYGQAMRSTGVKRMFCAFTDIKRCLEVLGY